MRPGITLRGDYDAARLRGLANVTRDVGQSRRLLALAEIYDGGSRTRAALIGGVGLQTVRDWVVKFNARGPEGLIDGKPPGNACKLNDRQREALANIVESGPTPALYGVVRWRLKDLTLWVWEENGAKGRAIPAELGPWWMAAQTVLRWSKLGVWEHLLI
jgi:transposase